ncbi:hypothetical protein Xen7305DRAFT_00026610 [Xenococcus sp. PCC 7305]|nr:hypothetical protein Xen7305DRAFT_00026610 [Xenococcus sp. PCC 7305]
MLSKRVGAFYKAALMPGEKSIALTTILTVDVENFVKPASGVPRKTQLIMQDKYVE